MDFRLSEEQTALKDLARTIFTDRCTHERLHALETASATVFDRDLWAALAEAGILGSIVPTEHGGAGYGLLELLPVLEEAGRAVAPVPLVPTLVVGALGIARFGDEDARAAWLPRIAAGEAVVSGALEADPGGAGAQPRVSAVADGDRWRLSGERGFVPYGAKADVLIVPALAGEDLGLFLVEPGPGVVATGLVSTNAQPLASVVLDGAVATMLVAPGPAGPEALQWLVERAAAATCAVQAGVCEGALRMTATYVSQREQFGKKIAEFQAVAQRAGDAFIDTQMVRLTAWSAVFRLSQGWEAAKEVHSAKFWAGDGAMRVVHATQHLHGGIGVDRDYPVHRYFLWAKQLEHTLGTPTRELIELGAILADEPV